MDELSRYSYRCASPTIDKRLLSLHLFTCICNAAQCSVLQLSKWRVTCTEICRLTFGNCVARVCSLGKTRHRPWVEPRWPCFHPSTTAVETNYLLLSGDLWRRRWRRSHRRRRRHLGKLRLALRRSPLHIAPLPLGMWSVQGARLIPPRSGVLDDLHPHKLFLVPSSIVGIA